MYQRRTTRNKEISQEVALKLEKRDEGLNLGKSSRSRMETHILETLHLQIKL